jgi:glycosyltransferase involved in cell wall biosynthesis
MTLKVAINAQLIPGAGVGGVHSVLLGLVHALAKLDGPEEYVVIVPWEEPDWLNPYLGRNQRVVRGKKMDAFKRALGPAKPLGKLARRAMAWKPARSEGSPGLARSNGFFEGLGCSVVHFPYQHFVISDIPAVFNPHDLQHAHYPQFFTPAELQWREVTYGAGCRAAHTVAVSSEWVKQDVIRHYQIEPKKIQVIRWAPPTQSYAEPTAETLEAVVRSYGLAKSFALYPAMTFEHKNHIRLLEALALLRDHRALKLNLVCTGHQNDFFPQIQKVVADLRLDEQVRFLGMVPPGHLRALYRQAQFMVFPSLFEAAGGPLVEAWGEGTPVTCSAVTSIPEQAGDAALLFDPLSVEAIATSLEEMATSSTLRERLRIRGRARLECFSWESTAKAYRAVYRRAAGVTLNDEDRSILQGGRS